MVLLNPELESGFSLIVAQGFSTLSFWCRYFSQHQALKDKFLTISTNLCSKISVASLYKSYGDGTKFGEF